VVTVRREGTDLLMLGCVFLASQINALLRVTNVITLPEGECKTPTDALPDTTNP
jgi:hypothetical protein